MRIASITLLITVVGAAASVLPVKSRTAALPPDSAYVTVDAEGHLSVNNHRIRFWGAIGSLPPAQKTIKGDPYYVARETVRRIKKVGFNLVRDWNIQFDDTAKKGDLSPTDYHDFFIDECGRQGVHIWVPSIMGGGLYEEDVEKAAAAAGTPATVAGWIATVKGLTRTDWWTNGRKAMSLLTPAVAWDPRLEAAAIASARKKSMHINLHNGLRLADNPTCAIWELTNEQWWMSRMMNGDWLNQPELFRKSLLDRWQQFLRAKYGTQEALTRAWGFTFPGEELAKGTILLAPLATAKPAVELNDTNPAAAAVFKGIPGAIGRDRCTAARGSDVIEFLLDVLVSHKKRCMAELKTWGKSCRLSPTVLDTGIGESIQAQYMQLQGGAVAHASYMEGIQLEKIRPEHKRFPFYSRLDQFPQMSNDVPWLEHNRPLRKPFLCYETQFGSPSKYRAEWPILIAALGSVQDWDGVNFHYWSFNQYDLTKDAPYGGALAWPGSGAYQYDYTSDEVEQAAMRAAGALFRNLDAAPAPHPTIFTWGKPALLDPRSMDYAGGYEAGRGLMDMMTTTYVNGERINIDPTQPEYLKSDGPLTRFAGYEKPCPLRPSANIEYDWQRGHVMFDAPGAAGYTGFLGQYGSDLVRFRNGVELRDVQRLDPPGTPYLSGAEKFTSFTLASEDGAPLQTCKSAVLALVASSFNTGLKIVRKPDGTYDTDRGHEPVLVTRVGATIAAPALVGMHYRMIDFNERVLQQGTVGADGLLKVPANQPVWLTELERTQSPA